MVNRLRRELPRLAFERGGALALAAVVVYAALAPAAIVDGDNAEFATLGAVGGRAHPPGYPLYVLYLRATSWIPAASPAHAAALATCLVAALAVLVLHAACRAWGARPLAATIACAIYAASPVVLRMHVEAEVFALNALVVATILWLAAAGGPARGGRRAALLGVVAGLGLANQLTCVLVAPIGVLGVVRGVREAGWRAAAGALAGFVVGLAPYAYLIVADGPASYGRIAGAGDLAGFVLRADYGGPGAFAGAGDPEPVANLGALVATLGRAWLWLPALVGLGALGRAIARPATDTRWGWAMLAATLVLAGPALVMRFDTDPARPLGLYIVQRFHLLPLLVLAVPVAAGIDAIAGDRLAARPRLAGAGIAVGALALVAIAWPRLAAQHSPAVDRGVANTLRALPPDAVAIVDTDDLCLGAQYYQRALGERPDVDVACAGYLARPWYQDRLRARGIALRPEAFAADVAALAAHRPVLVRAQTAAGPAAYPYGILWRVVPPGAAAPPLADIVELNRRMFAGYDLHYPLPGPDDDWATIIHRRYARTWILIARRLLAANKPELAADAIATARALFPDEDTGDRPPAP